MSVRQWDELPWYEGVLLLEGLKDQGIIGGGDTATPPGRGSPGKPSPQVDYATAPLLPRGFKTRRAG